MTELKVDLEPIRRAESSLDAATESLNQTRQDQGSLRSCVGDAPGLGDALGQLSSDWAIHRERLLKEVSELKTNLTQYRTKLEAMDEEGGKAMGGAGGSTSDTASPPVASGAAATPAAPGAASGSAATAAPIPAPSAGGVPVAPAPVPAGAVPGGPDQGSSTVPPPSAHAVTPPTPPGIEPTLQQAIDEDNRTVSGLVDRWSAEAQALAQRGLPLTALGPAAIALLALYGRLPSADAVGAAGPSAGMRAGDSADRDIDPAQARRLIEAADSGKPTTSPPADGSAGTPGGIPQEEPDVPAPSPVATTGEAGDASTDQDSPTVPTGGTSVSEAPAAAAAAAGAAGSLAGGAAAAASGGSASGGSASGGSARSPGVDLPPPPTPAAVLANLPEANTTSEGRTVRTDAGQIIGGISTQSAVAAPIASPDDARAALGAAATRPAMATSQVLQSAVGSLTALGQVGHGAPGIASGVAPQPASPAGGGGPGGSSAGGSGSSTVTASSASSRLSAVKAQGAQAGAAPTPATDDNDEKGASR